MKPIVKMIAMMVIVTCTSCTKSPYDKAIDYFDELSTEVRAATNQKEYDAVYHKIETFKYSDLKPRFASLTERQNGKTGADWDSAPDEAGTLLMIQS